MEAEVQNNFNTNAEAGLSNRHSKDLSLNIGGTEDNNLDVVEAENREIQKYVYVLIGVAWLMSIHMVIVLIELLRCVSSGVGPGGSSHIPQISTAIILTPVAIIFLVLYFLTPWLNEKIGIPSPQLLKIMSPIYDFVGIMLLMWILIYFGGPVGRNLGLVYFILDMYAGINFLYFSYAAGKVLSLRKRLLSESIKSELLEVVEISKQENA